MKNLMKLYALEKSGQGCIDLLETMVASELGISKEQLAAKYNEIADRVNSYASGCTNEQFKQMLYLEYSLMLNDENKKEELTWGTF